MQMQKLLTFFSKNISIYVVFNDQSFNYTLTNDIISFKQLGPDVLTQFLLFIMISIPSCIFSPACISFNIVIPPAYYMLGVI